MFEMIHMTNVNFFLTSIEQSNFAANCIEFKFLFSLSITLGGDNMIFFMAILKAVSYYH